MEILPSPLTKAQKKNFARMSRRGARYIARRFLHFNSSLHRLRFCGVDVAKIKGQGGVVVKATGKGLARRAGFGNLQVCGSVWSCPVCSAKINTVRAAELGTAIAAWHNPVFGPVPEHGPGRIILLTLTMRHRKGQKLDDLWTRGVSAGWHAVTSGGAWVAEQEQYGVWVPREVKTGKDAGQIKRSFRIGYARVVETTYGAAGWHVHIHALLFVRRSITGKEAFALGDSIFGRWSASLVAAGFDAPTLEHGVDVKLVGPNDPNRVADYFSKNSFNGGDNAKKLGWEAAGGTGKWGRGKNRTPFQILEGLCSGEDYPDFMADLRRWWVWEESSKGKRQMTWSPWLRSYLKLSPEQSDDEIAKTELGGDDVLTLREDQFDAVVRAGAHELLDAVEADDDMTAAHLWLDANLGIWRTTLDYALVGEDWVEVAVDVRVSA